MSQYLSVRLYIHNLTILSSFKLILILQFSFFSDASIELLCDILPWHHWQSQTLYMNKTRYHTADVHSSRHCLDILFEVNTKIKNKMSFNVYVLCVRSNLQRQTPASPCYFLSAPSCHFYILMSPTETHSQQIINNNSHY